ncbi:MFS transporter [Agromyces archimandritae]|uniref:MFS transporter n=1 Tax=Agromyces archimandritae TaxID=2781962 RepID=A0A975IMT1_9MICO|nr:MFS transporter [Agromyces archimandritae]QTX03848.1 MFS transporter [Agromyces archimandritae]
MPDAAPLRSGPLIATLAFSGIVVSLTSTLIVPLIGELPALFGTGASTAAWAVTATLLAGAVATPLTGRLGDLYGKRKVMLIALIPLILGSAVTALAGGIGWMIAGRALQGLATGVVPLGISMLRDTLPPERIGSAIALMSSSMGIGAAVGLPVAAAVAQYTDWRILFWVIAAVGLACIGLILWAVPPVPPMARGRFDAVGTIGLSIVLAALLLAVSKGAEWGWASPITLGLFVIAAVVAVAWGAWELRRADPLVDLRVAARGQVLLTNLASVLIGAAMYAQSLIIPQLMQLPAATGYGHGQSMLQMGLWMAPSGIAMMAVSTIGARLSQARGPKVTLIVGCAIMAVGYGGSTLLTGSLWGLLATTMVASAGVGFAYGAMPALVMGAVPRSETGSANSVNSLMRSIGTSVSAAVVGVVLATMSVDAGGGHAIPTLDGFRVGLLIGCGVALGAGAIALAIPYRHVPGSVIGHGGGGSHGGGGASESEAARA